MSGVVQFWHVLVLALVLGVVTAFETPVRQSFVIEMVGPRDLPNAVALNSSIYNTGRVIGPTIAGIVIASAGIAWSFLINAASTLAVIGAMLAMRPSELHQARPSGPTDLRLRVGLRYVRHRPDVLLAMALAVVIGCFGLNFSLTIALLAKEEFGRGASGYGVLSTAMAVGGVLGAVISGRRRTRPSARFLVASATVYGLLEALAGLMPTFAVTAVVLVPVGMAMLTFSTATNASVQLGVEPALRGRVMALYMLCFTGGTPVGAMIIGMVSGAYGPRWGLVVGGAACATASIALGALFTTRGPAPGVTGRRPDDHVSSRCPS
jgi:MFS family permease